MYVISLNMITACEDFLLFLIRFFFSLISMSSFHQTTTKNIKNNKTKDTRYRRSTKAKTSLIMRGKPTRILLLIESSIDRFQDLDP